MKKQILILLFALVFLAIYADPYVQPVRTMVIPPATVAMTIDGIDDEACWSAEQSTDAFNPTGSTGADADFTFTFKVCYDHTYLYIFGKILDDYESNWEWGGSNQWTFDNVEIFVDLDTNSMTTTYDTNTYQLRINRGIDSIGNDYGRDCKRSDHKYYWENTADGWLFECALNWKFVLGPGQKTEDILQYSCDVPCGFDVSSADSDTDGADHRDCQTAWDMDDPNNNDPNDRTEDQAYMNRTVFGIVTFDSYGCGEPWWNSVTEYNSDILKISPNPANNIISISNNMISRKYEIINLYGQVVLSNQMADSQNEIDISTLPNENLYFLRLVDANGNISVAKFLKE